MQARNRAITFAALLLVFFALPAEAAKRDKYAVPDIPQDRAQIVFLRRTWINAAATTFVFDVTRGPPRVVGKIWNDHKLVVDLEPGEYVFMSGNDGLYDFLKATVSADKRYHVVVKSVWPARFSMRPVRHKDAEFLYSSGKFTKMISKTKIADPFLGSMDIEDAALATWLYLPSWDRWQARSRQERDARTLLPGDSSN